MDVEAAPPSGDAEIDSLAESRWVGTALTFGFPTSAGQFTGYSAGAEPFLGFEPLNAVQQAAVRTILASLSGFTNLTFTESTGSTAGSAVLRFGMTTEDENTTAHGYLPSSSELGGDSWYSNVDGDTDNPVRGNAAWRIFLHEIGHTLGLIHPHEATPAMIERDDMRYTVMSYQVGFTDDDWDFVQTYMVEDIAALQFLYGANFNTNNTDSVYRWNAATGEMSINGVGQGTPGANRAYMALWDGGGTDTYDLSSYPADPNAHQSGLRINLTPGEGVFRLQATNGNWSVLTIYNAQLYNGDTRSLIENAIGTTGRDIITGNAAANYLDSNGGGDEVYGLGGDDTLVGGGALFGGDGNDTLSGGGSLDGGSGNDLLTGAEDDDRLYGQDGDDTLIGGGGADRLVGGPGANRLDGGDGNDTLEGDKQVDTLIGGGGNDALYGYDGNDTMQGGSGDDTYYVEDAGDQVVEAAGNGTDTISSTVSIVAPANVENVLLSSLKYGVFLTGPAINATGNLLNNTITGNFQANVIDGGAGADTMSGGGGNDTYYVDNPDDLVYETGEQNADTVYSSVSYVLRDTPPQLPGYDPYAGASLRSEEPGPNAIELLVLTGTAGLAGTGNATANTIQGNSGNNVLNGMDGSDTLLGGGGADQLRGGLGADVFKYLSPADSSAGQEDWLSDFEHGTDLIDVRSIATTSFAFEVFETGTPSTWTRVTIATDTTSIALRVAGTSTLADFLYVLVEAAIDQTLRGTAGNDSLVGKRGNDTIEGLAGNDLIISGSGKDTAKGGDGDDVLHFGSAFSAGDVADGGSGIDVLLLQGNYIGDHALTFAANALAGVEQIVLLAGDDASFGSPLSSYSYSLTTNDGNLAAGQWMLIDGDDLRAGENLTFNGAAETDGNYLVYAGGGIDKLTGGSGGDYFVFGLGTFAATDTIAGGPGFDRIAFRGNYTGADGVLLGANFSGVEGLVFHSGHDTTFGPTMGDFFYEFTTQDATIAAGHMLTIDGSALRASESLVFHGSAESSGSFTIAGGAGSDGLLGGQGHDTIHGGAGNDELGGGFLFDLLTGGAGNDSFRYDSVLDSTPGSRDGIADFTTGDRIDLSRIDANTLIAGDQRFEFIADNAFHGFAGELRAINPSGSQWLIQGDSDGNGVADFELYVVVTDASPITASDFLL
ncbi:MAG TPA: M10 family metallopeptidase C-terminal domain-containing protein [Croceibacterium sp.]